MDFHILTFVQHAFIRRIGFFVLVIPSMLIQLRHSEAWCLQKEKKLPFQPLDLTHLIKISLSLVACQHYNLCFCLIGFM